MTLFFPIFFIAALLVFSITVAVTDTVWRKIPNVCTVPFAGLGLLFSICLWCVCHFGIASPLDATMKELAKMGSCNFDVMFTYLSQVTPLWALVGFFLGFFILFLGFVIGGVGAGDLKLLAALGIWLGVKWFLLVFCVSILLACILSVCAIIAKGPLKMMRKMQNMRKIGSKEPVEYAGSSKDKKRRNRNNPRELKRIVPFAIPVALAVGIFLFLFITNTIQGVPIFYR